MKRALVAIALTVVIVGCTGPGANPAGDGAIVGEGTVHKGVGPECPETWHIATAEGRMLWPVEDPELQVEGLRVRFAAREKKDAASICMAGTIVEWTSLEKQAGVQAAVVSGSVAYRQRIALPPDAEVEVTLSDVSLQDDAAPVIATTSFSPDGRQVPLPFELAYDPAKIDTSHTYAVRATIRGGGRLMFATDAAFPVITRGRPTNVSLMLAQVGEEQPASPGDLVGSSWRLASIGGAPALSNVEATLEFAEGGRVAGKGSCNQFSGSVVVTGAAITFGPIASTKMACLDAAVGEQEKHYFDALGGAERFVVDETSLSIFSKGAAHPLRFTRMTP
jgi:putative lipoprotein